MANGLTGVNLVRCWVTWRILPLSRRSGLMCEYTSDVKDPLRYSPIRQYKKINDMTKTLLNESLETCSKVGLNPFFTLNKPSAVSIFLATFTNSLFINLPSHYYLNFCRMTPPF